MKKIDLLNMWVKGEKLPTKVKFDGKVWEYDELSNDYGNEELCCYLFEDYINEHNCIVNLLNNEVEIIEEQPTDTEKVLEKLDEKDLYLTENQQKKIVHTLNKIIDKISEMENK